jgi:hypothetical protein
MTWTTTELDALRRAYARGQTRVVYDGRAVEYGSAADLLSRIRTIEAEIARSSGPNTRPIAGYAAFSRSRT